MGGLTSLPARLPQLAAGAPFVAQTAQEGDTGGRAATWIKRPRPHPGLLRSEHTDLPCVVLTEDIMYRILASEVSLQRELVEPAHRTYFGLAQDTRDPCFVQHATETAFLTRSSARALTAMRLWVKLLPTFMSARQIQQLLPAAAGQWSEAEPIPRAQLNEVSPDQCADALLQLQQQMSKGSDPADAIDALQCIVSHDAQRPETYLTLARAKVAVEGTVDTLMELDTALKLRFKYEGAAILAIELCADSDPDAAIIGLRSFLKAAPVSINDHLVFARMCLVRNRQDRTRVKFETLKKIAPNDACITLALDLSNLQQYQYGDAERYLKEYAAAIAKSSTLSPEPGHQGLVQLAKERRNCVGALGWIDKITGSASGDTDGQTALAAGTKRSQLLGKLRRINEVQQASDESIADSGDVSDGPRRQALMNGICRAEVGMLMDVKVHDRARARVNGLLKNDPNNVEYSYQLAMLKEHDGYYDNMETLLREVIDLRPGQAIGYSVLDYSLAGRNVHLQEAQELLEKAVSLASDDPYTVDSLDRVKYRRGDLLTATDTLHKVWATTLQAEIGAHLDEVL